MGARIQKTLKDEADLICSKPYMLAITNSIMNY